jgi:dephospho-CoA kinase
VLLDAAVLLEAGWHQRCDAVVFVDASPAVRQRRVATRSGWSLEELQKREASQLDLEEKRRRSDLTISNELDDSQGGQQLLDFLCVKWGIGCKPLSNVSQQP